MESTVTLVAWYGLSGSGKSTRLNALRASGHLVFDDFMCATIRDKREFTFSRYCVDIVAALRQSSRCVIADIRLCEFKFRDEVFEILRELIPQLVIEWHCFDCRTPESVAACRDNVRYRAETTQVSCEHALRSIDEFAPSFSVAKGARLYPVVRARDALGNGDAATQFHGGQTGKSNAHPPAYVISLERASERRTRFFSAAKSVLWDVAVFYGAEQDELLIEQCSDKLSRISLPGCSDISITGKPRRSRGAYACALSHIQLWKKMLDERLPAICIFEDDAIIERPYDGLKYPPDADFVFLNDRVSALIPDEIVTQDELQEWVSKNPFAPLVPGCGLEAYIITEQGARKALKLMQVMLHPIDLQILACGHGTALASHHLAADKPVNADGLQIYTTTHPYTRHEDHAVSYLNKTNAHSKVQFGSGGFCIPGWVNCNLPEHDIRKPLKLASESADFLFAEHVIEHVTPQEAWNFIVECRRVLKPGGILRLCFPDIKKILNAKIDAFDRLVRKSGWSDGTRQGSVASTLFQHGHLGAWTSDSMTAMMEASGYEVTECRPEWSGHPDLQNIDRHWQTVGREINEIATTVLEGRKAG